VGFGTEILFMLLLGLLVLGPKRLHAMLGHVARAKAELENATPPRRLHPSQYLFPFGLCFGTSQERGLSMKTLRYGLVALTLLALTIFAPTTVAHAQAYSVLYDLGTRVGDPRNPSWPGVVAQGRDGNLYSTTAYGGVNGLGAMFKITPGGTLTVQYSFDSTRGMPGSGLTLNTDGDFYGTTVNAGAADFGTVFKITPGGTLTVLHSFAGGNDGQGPVAPPIQGTDGNFYYGTTTSGGTNNFGTVYTITTSGKLTTLYSFDLTHGANPRAPLLQATDGNFYGTTYQGGTNNFGTVYKITRFGKFTLLHSFDDRDGSSPLSALVQGSDGSFYGTTFAGGSHHSGVVFRITAAGEYSVLHYIDPFVGEGGSPHAGLVQATDGNLYGTTTLNSGGGSAGTIFRISPKSPYPYKVLYTFQRHGIKGDTPEVALVQHTNGILYGDTASGGTGIVGCANNYGCGVFYSLNVGLGPFVSFLPPLYFGEVGRSIQIIGQGFTGTTRVSFNGSNANFNVSSDTFLTAIVPDGATTGFVTVTTPGGTLKSNRKFRVIP
jgi:uncharacterized repeat protein (TIGR03803 family)